MKLDKQVIQQKGLPDIVIYELSNDKGISVRVTNYGCIILSIITPDKEGRRESIVAGFDAVPQYMSNPDYFGCIVGRCTSRTSGASFTIDGKIWRLSANKGTDHLHGGMKGLDQRYWEVERERSDGDVTGVVFCYHSPHGEEGYPGNLVISAGYFLDNDNRLTLEYKAVTDEATPVNLTNHSYFNLSGFAKDTINDHELRIHAGKYTPLSEALVPSGAIFSVQDTVLDFRKPVAIGLRFGEVPGESYDHNFVLDKPHGEMGQAAELSDPLTGRILRIYTDQPCLGLYTSGYLDGTRTGTQGKRYQRNGAVCLETQQYPDAMNRPEFPSTLIVPGEVYQAITVFEFGT